MSNQRFTPEFKNEAVRQVMERGYSGVSAHSLYKGGKAAKPDGSEQRASELLVLFRMMATFCFA